MSIFFLLFLSAIALLTISRMSGQRQRAVFQAIEGGSEALIINILLLPLVYLMILYASAPWLIFLGGFYGAIQLLYVMLRSRSLSRHQQRTHPKMLGHVLDLWKLGVVV